MPATQLYMSFVPMGGKTLKIQITTRSLGRSQDFAALAAFLASEPAGYVTGQAIACDGALLQSI